MFIVWASSRDELRYRPTKDIDLLSFGDSSPETLKSVFLDILSNWDCPEGYEDGLEFQPGTIEAVPINADKRYDGVHVSFKALLGKSKISIHVDIGFGDATVPAPEFIDFPSVLDG